MNKDPEFAAHHEKLIAEGRLHPAKDPGGLLKAKSLDRGIKAEQIDKAVEELREDRS